MPAMGIGDFLREARRAARFYSVHAAGRAIGVTGQAISNWETGKSAPAPKHYGGIARAYGLSKEAIVQAVHGINQGLTTPGHDFVGVEGKPTSEAMLYQAIQDIMKLRTEMEAKLREIDRRLAALEGEESSRPRRSGRTS